jgi:hypothetical protein
MPVAFADEGDHRATKSASVTKQIKKLKQRVSQLEQLASQPGPQGPKGDTGATGPAGSNATINGIAAGGDLTGAYPSPTIAAGAIGTPEFSSSIPAVHVTHDALQPIVDNETTVAFNTERYDTANMHDTAPANNSRLTAPVSGVYLVTAQLYWTNVLTDGDRSMLLRKNGTTYIGVDNRLADVAATPQAITTQVKLAAGDYIEVRVDESEPGGGDNVSTDGIDEASPEFAMTWLAPG